MPPRRLRLATKPAGTESPPVKTIATLVVAPRAAKFDRHILALDEPALLKAEKQRSSGRSCFRIAEKFYSAALPAARPTARYAAAAPPSSEMKYRRKFIDRRKCIPVVQALTVATLF